MAAEHPAEPLTAPLERRVAPRPRILVFVVDRAGPANAPPEAAALAALGERYDLVVTRVADRAGTDVAAWSRAEQQETDANANADVIALLYGARDLAPRLETLIAPIIEAGAEAAFAPPGRGRAEAGLRGLALHTAFWPLREHFDPRTQSFALSRAALQSLPALPAGTDLALAMLVHGGTLKALPAGSTRELPPTPLAVPVPTSWHGVASEIRRAAALSGALISYGTAARFSAVGLIAMAVDLTVFKILLLAHFGLSAAHISSFVLSALINFQLNSRWTFEKAGRRQGGALARQYLRFFAIAVMALTLRGGFLGLATNLFGLPPLIGILFGIAAATSVTFLGNAFFVFPTRRIETALPWRIAAVGIFAYGLLLRLVYIGQVPLFPEEAYYWEYARHLALGYLDHPPMVAWTTAFATHLLGTNEFALRLIPLIVSVLTMAGGYFYARDLYGKAAALVSVLLLSSLPYFFGAALLLTPDAYLTAAWMGTLLFLERALLKDQPKAWIGAGLCLGLGMLSKYTIALLGPAALLFVVLEPRARRWLLRPEPYLGTLLACLLFTPVVIWNAEHHWASFVFQGSRRMAEGFSFGLPALVGDVMALLTPFGAVAAVIALARRQQGVDRARWRFEAIFTLVPFAVFFAFSLTHEVKLNWTGPIWFALVPAIAALILAPRRSGAGKWALALQRSWKPVLVSLFLVYGVLFHYLTLGLPGVGYPKSLHGLPASWPDMAREAVRSGEALASRTGQPPIYVGLDKYDFASEIDFYSIRESRKQVIVAGAGLFGGNGLMYDYWRDAGTPLGRSLILFGFHARDLETPAISAHCTSLGPVQAERAERLGRPAARYFQRLCFGYRDAAAPHVPARQSSSRKNGTAVPPEIAAKK